MNMKIKKNKIKISFMALASLFLFAGLANAESSLYVSPETLTVNTNSNVTSWISVLPNGEKVCVVKGTISFNNLTCKNVIMEEGLMAQSVPTCSNPNFTIGIPTCTTVAKNLFTIQSTTNKNSGIASISLSNLNIIGEGVSVGSKSNITNYTVKAPQPPKVTVKEPIVVVPEEEIEVENEEAIKEEVEEVEKAEEKGVQKAAPAEVTEESGLVQFIDNNKIAIYSVIVILLIVLVALYIRTNRKK